jgi:hypothetical protein
MTSSSSTLSLVSLSRARINLSLADLTDLELQTYLDTASQLFMTLTNRKYWSDEYEDIISGDGSRTYLTRVHPLISVDEIEFDNGTKFTSSDIKIGEETGFIYAKDFSFTSGVLNITIRYTAGWANIPEDIQEAICNLAALQYSNPTAQDMQAESILDYSYRIAKVGAVGELMLPAVITLVINKYKNLRV